MNNTTKPLFMQKYRLSFYGRNRALHEQTIIATARHLLRRRAANLGIFQFYGMRALLILYLTNQLKYDDSHAYALFSAYCSLVYVTPILGGFPPINSSATEWR